ncbi:NADH dehydrogenase [ubiquinone] iron-sulfur protein 5-B isoform X1 [Capsicum annuum]|uniref:NADH dehydrogenase [ubiquinone] iron-sulfur protein 5-B isoform X1 n=1 Tax=Capsicum annuum TaxID=4072 RepID=UPI001FB05958|nr:NADH dehydrogenase [ubiquinone] iron-sulfur protein 5-B isoform X1 [Capsicum annuum]
MASGWGITGNKGRCYDFWMDFSECMSKCREPKDCSLLREDYFECLHHSKELRSFSHKGTTEKSACLSPPLYKKMGISSSLSSLSTYS